MKVLPRQSWTDSGEQVPERAERFTKAMELPGIVDAATDSPNAPERGEVGGEA